MTGPAARSKKQDGTLKKQGRTLNKQGPTLFFRESTLFFRAASGCLTELRLLCNAC